MKRILVTTAPTPVGAYSQAVVDDTGTVYISGQLPVDPDTGAIVDGGAAEQTHQSLRNIQNILEGAGLTLADVVRAGIYLTDMRHFADMNTAYADFFPDLAPARSAIGVAALPSPAAVVEIDVIARRRSGN